MVLSAFEEEDDDAENVDVDEEEDDDEEDDVVDEEEEVDDTKDASVEDLRPLSVEICATTYGCTGFLTLSISAFKRCRRNVRASDGLWHTCDQKMRYSSLFSVFPVPVRTGDRDRPWAKIPEDEEEENENGAASRSAEADEGEDEKDDDNDDDLGRRKTGSKAFSKICVTLNPNFFAAVFTWFPWCPNRLLRWGGGGGAWEAGAWSLMEGESGTTVVPLEAMVTRCMCAQAGHVVSLVMSDLLNRNQTKYR